MKEKELLAKYFADHRDEMVEDVCRMVRVDSVKGAPQPGMPYGPGPAAALDAMAALAESYGFAVQDHDHRLITVDLNDQPRALDMVAHLDVVPVGEGWTETEPFVPAIKDGRIYGRGTSDDKGPAVAALYALRAVKELGISLGKNVRLILGSDEESGMSDVKYYYKHNAAAPMTFSPDGGFPVINIEKGKIATHFTANWPREDGLPRLTAFHCGEKSNVLPGKARAEIAGLSAGDLRPAAEMAAEETGIEYLLSDTADGVRIVANGVGAHVANPKKGNNALTGLLALLCRLPLVQDGGLRRLVSLLELFPHGDNTGAGLGIALQNEESGDLTALLTVLHLEGNELTGDIDIRIPLNATRENTVDVLMPRLQAAGIDVTCDYREPHAVSADSPLVQELLRCYEAYTGRKGEALAIGGSTYVHWTPGGVAFGCTFPETDYHAHGADEFMEIDTLLVSGQMFAQAIIDLCR